MLSFFIQLSIITTGVPDIATEHYEGSHWLASFAVYALLMEF